MRMNLERALDWHSQAPSLQAFKIPVGAGLSNSSVSAARCIEWNYLGSMLAVCAVAQPVQDKEAISQKQLQLCS